jgi:hypothetical protein
MLINSLVASLLLISQSNMMNDELLKLKKQLESYGFEVRLEASPVRGSYGLLHTESKQIWIDPLVFELGIAKPTLIHEAVHAAQYCAGNGEIQALGLTISPPNVARPFFMRYQHGMRRHLEAEAYAVQTHPDGLEMVMSLLAQYCSQK